MRWRQLLIGMAAIFLTTGLAAGSCGAAEPGVRKLTNLPDNEYPVAIDGNTLLVATIDTTARRRELYALDLTRPTIIPPPVIAETLSPNLYLPFDLGFSGDVIVWQRPSYASSESRKLHVCRYDATNQTCPEQTLATFSYRPYDVRIANNLVVWQRSQAVLPAGSISAVSYCKYKPAQATVCTEQNLLFDAAHGPDYQLDPETSQQRILWLDYREGPPGLYTCKYNAKNDKCPAVKVSTMGTGSVNAHRIAGTQMAWSKISANGKTMDIYAGTYHGPTKSLRNERRLASRPISKKFNCEELSYVTGVSSRAVTWTECQGKGTFFIYLQTLDAGSAPQLLDSGTTVGDALLSGTRAVWARNDPLEGDRDVYLYDVIPSVSAGEDQTIMMPASGPATTSLGGWVDRAGVAVTWSKVTGPGSVTFSPNATTLNATAAFSIAGTYVLRLTAEAGETDPYDDVLVTVKPPGDPNNQPPVVTAFAESPTTFPAGGSVSLSGSISDDGLPVGGTPTVLWKKQSGPGTVTFSKDPPDTRRITATIATAGSYVLVLTANDGEKEGSAPISITVTAP